jgi:hypothetical protein
MKEKLAKLIDLKSIITILMTIALIILLFKGEEVNETILALYCTSYGSVMTYYFSRKEK